MSYINSNKEFTFLAKMKNLLLNLFFPCRCVLCSARGHDDLELCPECCSTLPIIKNDCKCCKQCGQILDLDADTNITPICGACLKDPPPFEQTIAIFHYKQPIDYLILNLKFNNKLPFAALLGKLMARQLLTHYSATSKPEVIIPVPLHPQRLKERGFNQAIELARPISKSLNIPIDKYSFVRVKNTQAQSLLKVKERKQNVKQAFVMKKPVNYNYVAIIDDVITTGNTTKEFCKILRKAGIKNIDVWSAARAHLE